MGKSFLNQNNLSRGLRNNNPGNIIYTGISWQGKIPYSQNSDWYGTPSNIVKKFEQFTDVYQGIRAMAYDIYGDVEDGNLTLTQLIHQYAPASENNTQAYINYIASVAGVNPNEPIKFTPVLLAETLRAIINYENGEQMGALITDEDIVHSINLLPPLILDQLGEFVQENKGSIAGALILSGIGLYAGYRIYKYAA